MAYALIMRCAKFTANNSYDSMLNSLIFSTISNTTSNTTTQKDARQLHYGFIYSKITYGLEVYGYISASNVSRLQTM